jgi:hypothetical protein
MFCQIEYQEIENFARKLKKYMYIKYRYKDGSTGTCTCLFSVKLEDSS